MSGGSVRWSVDPKATTRLRFDDPAFEEALRCDDDDDDKPIARVLGVKHAADFDFSSFVADGVYLDARLGITGAEEDELTRSMVQDDARRGTKMDPGKYNNLWFAMWVVAVGDELSEDSGIPGGLSAGSRKVRADTVAGLPVPVRDALLARLRSHVDAQTKPAMRDPGKTAPKSTAAPSLPDMLVN